MWFDQQAAYQQMAEEWPLLGSVSNVSETFW